MSYLARAAVNITLLVIVSGCKNDEDEAQFWENERIKIELEHRMKLAEYRLGQSESNNVLELAHWNCILEAQGLKLRNLQQRKVVQCIEIVGMETRNDELYRIAQRNQRALVQGMKFGTFSTKDGRTFHRVIIAGVADSGVKIRHEHGAANLRYTQLTNEQRLFFGLDKATSIAAEERERAEELAYERSIDQELEAMRQRDLLADADAQQKYTCRFSLSSLVYLCTCHHAASRPMAQPARRLESGLSYRRWPSYSKFPSHHSACRYIYRYPLASPQYRLSSKPCRQRRGHCASLPLVLPKALPSIPTYP